MENNDLDSSSQRFAQKNKNKKSEVNKVLLGKIK